MIENFELREDDFNEDSPPGFKTFHRISSAFVIALHAIGDVSMDQWGTYYFGLEGASGHEGCPSDSISEGGGLQLAK